jgi:hypothetical protein
MKERNCPNCGMPKSQWIRNDGRGVSREGTFYCCEGCAVDNRCTCMTERNTKDRKGRKPAHAAKP